MIKTDKRIDAYIEKAKPFAQPVLNHIRKLVHKADPEIEETIKWGMPHFVHDGIVCSMASFKEHCVFVLWKGDLISDVKNSANKSGEKGMGQFGRIRSLKDLPSDSTMIKWIKEGVRLNKEGVPIKKTSPAEAIKKNEVPGYMLKEIKKSKKALKVFNEFPPSHKKEYIEWITDAKTDATREKRMTQMMEWLEEGKSKNWKYMKPKKTG
ncbi:MAG: hypothetical protein DWQ44_13480 [Bacteroidetes bacterium]|nr:MAG: hypothetical protein DWQ33_08290 [Bacteroidota bacterium]REK05727.1 MAG: hypothetical protein DWQ39_04765 [Bacteroidota bacterium]REK31967.1 MAG: hypothetical protein DWQ44_13480 [Bacteroidota bacterium]REK50032.1 MAG: hypothetical protein DWQ48_05705 [Bacteroidota bacterium]